MTKSLSRDQVRDVDRRAIAEFGITGLVLMENAGRGCVNALLAAGCRGPVVICCGKGNNGGDGFVIARHLDAAGIAVRLLLLADPAELQGDALANYQIAAKSRLMIRIINGQVTGADLDLALQGAEWIVDALLGTGATGNPKPPYSSLIQRMNLSSARVLAVDLPSGLDCDTGRPAEPTIRADQTCTFVAAKKGFENPAASEYLGAVQVVEIGVPRCLLAEFGLS
ncbi:Bifunctional NAD(P)H-hydrate repair enzyme Nnr [Anatilimnocola aggregata]|uniref:NAD(P)H-hydrate epimerase n=1 Tax=Anatilimnocola aggregata TaxID=2528021 RepID=A0A517YEV6_9BACT|nr:NAD(P)H-hydrate epimerase [Anatilimnocola aggregata]QDU28741.1 Bifunctional NAD(P)H-hydrate repair enzyme Nnr [Anatilimnocola aggregata]